VVIAVIVLFAVLLGGATALLPVFARDILHAGPVGLGLLRSAPAVGALATSVFLAHYPLERRIGSTLFRSVIVFGAMEAALTPLMEAIEREFAGIKVFSLPSVDHPEYGRHIELGVKGHVAALEAAYAELLVGLKGHDAVLGPELVR